MRVETDAGAVIQLGVTETAPTIGITDYSRRVTDDFGVTTVVERGFSRRLSVRLAVPSDAVDQLQRTLAALRATPAKWVADDDLAWLSVDGFFKDFDLDLAVPPLSFCTLSVEGLAETAIGADEGGDPAPEGASSTLRLLQPVTITDAMLNAASIAEVEYPIWSAGAAYPSGARVIVPAAHRVYESLIAGNVAHDPTSDAARWLDVGPTNRWAMFDQALGTTSHAVGSVSVTLGAGTVDSVALLDVVGSTVRVQAPGYDQTRAVDTGTILFLDLPTTTGDVVVTIAGAGEVSVGTLLIGRLHDLGVTEAAPTAGITDFSRKEIDDFGEVTVAKRAYQKRMTARALIRTDAVDQVADRIAAVRARPSLWIGDAAFDSLTLYGFFKDFSIEVGENVSKLSLSLEGLSTAAPIKPLGAAVNWPDIADPEGTKPDNNATNGGDPNSPFGPDGKTVGDVIGDLGQVKHNLGEALQSMEGLLDDVDVLTPGVLELAKLSGTISAIAEAQAYLAGVPIGTVVTETRERTDSAVEDLKLLGKRSLDGKSWALDLTTVYVDGTTTLGQRMQQIRAESAAGLNAVASDLITTVIEGEKASGSRLAVIEATLGGASGLTARVGDLTTATVGPGPTSLASRLGTVEASITDENGDGIAASVKELEEATITGEDSVAKRVGVIESNLNQPGTGLYARTGTLEQAVTAPGYGLASRFELVETGLNDPDNGLYAQVGFLREVTVSPQTGVNAKAVLALNAAGRVAGMVATANNYYSALDFEFDRVRFFRPDGTLLLRAGGALPGEDPDSVYMPNVVVDRLRVGSVNRDKIAGGQITGVTSVAAADTYVGSSEVVLIETTGFALGDAVDGKGVAFVSFTQDGTAVADSGIRVRTYVDFGSGYVLVRNTLQGIRASGGDVKWALPVGFAVPLYGSSVSIRVTAQSSAIASGPNNYSYARDILLTIFGGAR